jgi:hypothetical protein
MPDMTTQGAGSLWFRDCRQARQSAFGIACGFGHDGGDTAFFRTARPRAPMTCSVQGWISKRSTKPPHCIEFRPTLLSVTRPAQSCCTWLRRSQNRLTSALFSAAAT